MASYPWFSTTKDDYLKPAPELNWFDIKVIFDGKKISSNVAEPLEEQHTKDESGMDLYNYTTATRWYGKHVPVILWNATVVTYDQISKFSLYYDDFVPYLDLTLRDKNGLLQFKDVPGYANIVTLVMIPHADDKYKGISLSFFIRDISFTGDFVHCYCELRLPDLEKRYTEQLVFHWPSPGCPPDHVTGIDEVNNNIVDCPRGPNKHPNTYELLHVIAEETGLGFAATDKCAEIADDKHRMLHKEKYKETIPKHIRFGGVDENSIFDSWIDLYGYITMVNVPWVMTQSVNIHNIAMHAEVGLSNVDVNLAENKTTPLTHRVVTNARTQVVSNMYAESYENIVSNEDIFNGGSQNTYFDMNPFGVDGTNSYSTKGIQQIENSLDGKAHVDKYRFDEHTYRGAEMGTQQDDNFPELHQQSIHDNYFSRIRAKRLKVRMAKPNYGLMRGTLIGFVWYESDTFKKRLIRGQFKNAFEANKDIEEPVGDEVYDDLDNTYRLMNPFISGIYYIDGMIFSYDEYSGEFKQYLILIKKDGLEAPDMISNMANHETKPKVKENI